MTLSQDSRLIKISASFITGSAIAEEFQATERFSEPYCIDVNLLSDNHDLTSKDVIGQNCCVELNYENEDTPRYFHGRVNALSLGDVSGAERSYRLRLVPGFWFLSQTSQYRIFENMNAKDIIIEILRGHGSFCTFDDKTAKTYLEREYCVQFGETDFDFVNRLMQEEGIAYYFIHEQSDHTMVLCDDTSGYYDCPEDTVKFNVGSDFDAKARIMSWNRELQYHASSYEMSDYNHDTPKNFYKQNIQTKHSFAQTTSEKTLTEYSNFAFKGAGVAEHEFDVNNNKQLTQVRLEALEAGHDIANGSSICGSFSVGGRFTLKHHIKSEANTYVLTEVVHMARDGIDSDADYQNQFTCIPSTVVFRAPQQSTKNSVRGPLNAKVVELNASESAEDVDPHRMIKVQFPWNGESNSCWMRVAQSYAGPGWGASFVPRLDQEVLVDFINGDPDRPLVVGALYNKDNQGPQYTSTQSGFKTESGNFNELRFDDKSDAEEIYVEAGKDYNYIVHNDETGTVENDQKLTVINNRDVTVSSGNETKKIESGNQILEVAGDQNVEVDGAQSVTITGNISEESKASIETKAAQKITLQANTSIELKVGGNSIKIDASGITIKGTMVKAEGSAMTEVKSGGILKMQGSLVQIN